jgi:hypothetical protein
MPNRSCVHPLSPPKCRALRAISPGEEVTIAYVELATPRVERQLQLRRQYFFDCDASLAAGGAHEPSGCGGGDDGGRETGGGSTRLGSGGAAGGSDRDGRGENAADGGGGGIAEVATGAVGHAAGGALVWGAAPARSDLLEPPEGAGGGGGGGFWLHCFGPSPRPPWREDPPDAAMCEVLLPPPAAGGAGAALPGGMLLLLQGGEGGEGGGEDGGLGPASGSFPTGPGAGDDEEGGGASPTPAAAAGEAAQGAGWGGGVVALQWGDWDAVGAQASAGLCGLAGAPQLPEAAARQLRAVLRLQADAERLSSAGDSGGAADALTAALRAAGCLPRGPWASAAGATAGRPQAGIPAVVALGPRHVLRQRLLAALLNACVAAGDRWSAALAAAEALAPCYEAAYPRVSDLCVCAASTIDNPACQADPREMELGCCTGIPRPSGPNTIIQSAPS